MIKFHCAQCQAKIGVEDRHAGRSLKCPKCGAIARVPTPVPPSPSYPSDNVLAGALELENAARAQARSQDEIVELEPQQASPPIDRPMMLQPPAKLERPMHREKFTLTWWAVLIYLAGAALVTFSYSQQYESFEYWASRAAGAVFGLSMFSLLASWLVFRASQRSVFIASAIFSSVVIMLTLGSFTRLLVDRVNIVTPWQHSANSPSEEPIVVAAQATREQFDGFSFEVPSGWTRVKPDRTKTKAMLLFGSARWQNPKAMIKVDVGKPVFPTAHEMANSITKDTGGQVASATIDFNGEAATKVTTTSENLSTPREINIIYRNGKVYLVMAGAVGGVDLTKVMEHIRSTWKWDG